MYALAEIFFCTPGEYVTMSNDVFNFNFIALLLSEILGGSQIYTNYVFNLNILALVVSEILGGPKFTLGGPVPPSTPPSGNFFVLETSTLLEASTLLCLMRFLISTF